MKQTDVAHRRLRNLRLWGTPLGSPESVVGWLGAVQSQEFGPAKWSVAERTTGVSDAGLNAAYAEGTILRTHVLRPTWHFVLPDDIRWMLDLTGPRVHRQLASYDRQLEVDAALIRKAQQLMVKALEREKRLTRQELRAAMEKGRLLASGQRLNRLVMHAELDGLICSGGLRGKQHTYALLEERAPNAKRLDRDEALHDLTVRYFTSHGPATRKDFNWWSGLTAGDVKRGIELAGAALERETIDDLEYHFAPAVIAKRPRAPRVHLLQPYDELVVGYTQSRYVYDPSGAGRANYTDAFASPILLDARLAGAYKIVRGSAGAVVRATLFEPFDAAATNALEASVKRLRTFLGTPVELATTVR